MIYPSHGIVVVFDVETTGLSPADDEVIDLGAVKLVAGRPTGNFEAFLRPTRPLGESAAIHGISEETEKIWNGGRSKKLPGDIQERTFLKLWQLHAADLLADLRIPPSNRLESLSGNLAGFWSVRINQQWRLIFRWNDGKASDVKITDYH